MIIWSWWGYAYPFAFIGLGTMLQEWLIMMRGLQF